MESFVEPHLRWRLLTPQDTDELARLREQMADLDASVLSEVAASATEIAPHSVEGLSIGGWDDYETLSAYGIAYLASTTPLRLTIVGGVHPARRHRGIGLALLRWQVDRAIRWRDELHPGVPLRLECFAEKGRTGLERIAVPMGFEPERFYFDLHRDLGRSISITTVEGVTITAFSPEHSEQVRTLHNLCFAELGGGEVDQARWQERLRADDFRAAWSFVAEVNATIVGYAMSGLDDEGEEAVGWTERFGVHPSFRHRGIAVALLTRCLAAMRDDGLAVAGVGVDTPDQEAAQRFADAVGYTTRDAVALLTKMV